MLAALDMKLCPEKSPEYAFNQALFSQASFTIIKVFLMIAETDLAPSLTLIFCFLGVLQIFIVCFMNKSHFIM